MKILFAASEILPYAKTGGLADVAASIPKALKSLGDDVISIMPFYHKIDPRIFHLEPVGKKIRVLMGNKMEEGALFKHTHDGITTYLIKHDGYYGREELYGTKNGDYEDNAERFIFFSKAILEAAKELSFQPDIIHLNDWQTGMTSLFLKTHFQGNEFFKDSAVVFTIHNIGYQGIFEPYELYLTNLGWELFTPSGIEFYGKINFLKAGLLYSDILTTVSKKYSEEIQSPEFGYGLDGVLCERKNNLYGIINGVDYDEWSPEADKYIAKRYSPDDLDGKKACKEDLQKIYGLKPKSDTPLIGIISRLADQKGFDLLDEIAPKLMELDIQMVLLGTGDKKYHDLFEDLKAKYPGKFGVKLAYSVEISHKIEAGADMFLMPSRYEPCGLNQLYSLKYGTIPIVRGVGGLDDTITNYDPKTSSGNGFKFYPYDGNELFKTILEAVNLYKNKKEWEKLVKKAMREDFSWNSSAKEYQKIYELALKRKRG